MAYQTKLITGLAFLVMMAAGFVGSCHGYTFHVGAKHGWALDPPETFNHWAERNRFQVNDTLLFKYTKGLDLLEVDSVLVVNEEAYNTCNKTNPQETLIDDNPVFTFNRSGPFFFISGHAQNCENGQKLIVVVMAVRHHNGTVVNSTTAAAPPAPAPGPPAATLQTKSGETKVHAPAPAPATSGATVTSTSSGGSFGLILALGLCLIWGLNGF